ncbi:MAG: hypothetical protein WCK34_15010 [Bacteroidota bacterium]
MEIVKRITAIFLLLVFLFGITGLSVFHHTCTGSNEEKRAAYAEIFKEAPGSCCSGEAFQHFTINASVTPRHIEATPCCKSTNTFLTLQVLSERQLKTVVQNAMQVMIPFLSSLPAIAIENQFPLQPRYFQFHSPPLFGKQLVHFLHQSKIPAHHDLA